MRWHWDYQRYVLLVCLLTFSRLLYSLNSSKVEELESNGCSCFSVLRQYIVNEKGIAILNSVELGVGITAIPWRNNVEALSKWLSETGFYQISYKVDTLGYLSIQEFTLGVVVTAGPLLTYAQRSRLINELSENNYFRLKRELEQEKDSRIRTKLKEKLYEIHKKFGFKTLKKNEQHNWNRKMFVFLHTKGKNATQKNVWKKQCKTLCEQVIRQPDSELIWDLHLEFAFLKNLDDPPDAGEFLSREPLHVANTFFEIPLDENDSINEQIVKQWKNKFKKRYQAIFSILKKKNAGNLLTTLQLAEKFEINIGEITSWKYLLHNRGIVRDATDFNFPDVSYSDVVNEPHLVNMRVGKELNGIRQVLPHIIEEWNSNNFFEVTALTYSLKRSPSFNLRDTEDKTDFIYHRVSPLYQFRALIENTNEGGYRLIEAYTGHLNSSYTGIDFLGILLSLEKSEQLKNKLHDIILNVWAPIIIKSFREVIDKKSKTIRVLSKIKLHKEREWISFYNNKRNSNSFMHFKSPKLTIRYKNTDFRPVFDQDSRIQKISIDYIGGLDLVCYQETSQNATDELAFVVKPVSSFIQRVDGMNFEIELEGSCTVIVFFDHGLRRIFNGVQNSFRKKFHIVNPDLHDLLYNDLFLVLNAEKNMSMFHRNTCQTDGKNRVISTKKVVQLYDMNSSLKMWELPSDEQALHLLVKKCYARILPAVCMKGSIQEPLGSDSIVECSQIPGLKSYGLVERSVQFMNEVLV